MSYSLDDNLTECSQVTGRGIAHYTMYIFATPDAIFLHMEFITSDNVFNFGQENGG